MPIKEAMTPAERIVRNENSETAEVAPPAGPSYAQFFTRSAVQHERATALRFQDENLSYGELNARANQLAHGLVRHGVGPEVLVAVSLDRSIDLMVALLAVWKAGGAFVPLDPAYPRERREFMLRDSGARLLITQSKYLDALESAGATVMCVDDPNTRQAWEHLPRNEPPCEATEQSLAYVIYTSGSTGSPKGVEIPHRALLNHNHAIADAYGLRPEDRVLQFGSISFDLAFEEIFPTWLNGATLVLRTEQSAASMKSFLSYLERESISVLILPTAFWHELVDHVAREPLPSTVRLVSIGGEAASKEAYRRWKQFVPETIKLINTYGPTETTITATLFVEDRDRDDLPIGRPLANLSAHILDDTLQPVPPGDVGELCIGGLGLARGYRHRPELTAARFINIPDIILDDKRVYRTGDLVRMGEDGNLEFLGRADNQVKVRGFRIELGEIEETLRTCPTVKDAVVIAREDQPGNKRLVAYCLTRPPARLSTNELQTFLRKKLPSYMVPNAWVQLETFPVTPSGKIDRRALPPPGKTRPELAEPYIAPRTTIEEQLTAVWRDVLGLNKVGIRDSLLDLGGDSLLALQITSRVRERLQRELPLASLFEAPTIEAVAALLERSEQIPGAQVPHVARAPRERPLPVSSVQGRLWFLNQLDPGSDAYNMPAALRLRGALDAAALERALNQVINRHEILRTTFVYEGDLAQTILPEAPARLGLKNLADAADPESALERALTDESRHPFNLAEGPLLRATLFRMGEAEHVLLVVMHHIIWDGWSMGIFFEELEACYNALVSKSPPPELPELPVQYADYARWQNEFMSGPTLAQEQRYWRQKLAGAPGEIRFPTTHPGTNSTASMAGRRSSVLDDAAVARATAFANQQQVTPFMVLLASLAIALHKYTGQRDMVIGTVVAGRSRREFEALIGCFMNFIPLRVTIEEGWTAGRLLEHVRNTVVEAQAHQDCPFEKIVSAVNPRRTGDRNPLYNVALLWHNFPLRGVFQNAGLEASLMSPRTRAALLDLRLEAEEQAGRWNLDCEYNSVLFDERTAAIIMQAFSRSLELLIQNPELKLEELHFTKPDNQGWLRRLCPPWSGRKNLSHISTLVRGATGLFGPKITGLCETTAPQLPL